jgi:hypothetical protein
LEQAACQGGENYGHQDWTASRCGDLHCAGALRTRTAR